MGKVKFDRYGRGYTTQNGWVPGLYSSTKATPAKDPLGWMEFVAVAAIVIAVTQYLGWIDWMVLWTIIVGFFTGGIL